MTFLNLAKEVFKLCNNHPKYKLNYNFKFADTMVPTGMKAGSVTCLWCKSLMLREVIPLNSRMWEMKGVVLWEAIFQSISFQFQNIHLVSRSISGECNRMCADKMFMKLGKIVITLSNSSTLKSWNFYSVCKPTGQFTSSEGRQKLQIWSEIRSNN